MQAAPSWSAPMRRRSSPTPPISSPTPPPTPPWPESPTPSATAPHLDKSPTSFQLRYRPSSTLNVGSWMFAASFRFEFPGKARKIKSSWPTQRQNALHLSTPRPGRVTHSPSPITTNSLPQGISKGPTVLNSSAENSPSYLPSALNIPFTPRGLPTRCPRCCRRAFG